MHAGDEKSSYLEVSQCLRPDERHVEIARAGTVRIERRAIAPTMTGDGAAAQHDDGARRNGFLDRAAEVVEALDAAAEGKPDDVIAFLPFGQLSLDCLVRHRIDHGGEDIK